MYKKIFIINKNTFAVYKIQVDKTIGIVQKGIIYERMINGLYFENYLRMKIILYKIDFNI